MAVEIKERGHVRLPAFLERGFSDLRREVVARRRCSMCGTCAAFCDKIGIEDGEPRFIEDYDTVCGLCYTVCPRTFLPRAEIEQKIFGKVSNDDDVLGVYRACYEARTKKADIGKRGQDGGVVTSILAYALETEAIDCAVLTTANGDWRPRTEVARDYEALKEGAGTKYTLYPSVRGVREAQEEGCSAIAFVGLPCQIQGLRKAETANANQPYELRIDGVKLLIGLFCTKNYNEELLDFVNKQVPLERVKKFDIKGKELLVYDNDGGVVSFSLNDLEVFVGDGCSVCTDFTAELADISVGSVGSAEGWSTVITRTERGDELVRGASESGYIEVKDIKAKGLELIKRQAVKKRKRVEETEL